MTFTYDPSRLDDLLHRVRLELGDTDEGDGVKPNGGNLQDEEILAIAAEQGYDLHLTLAKLCRLLATQWARFADVSAGKVREAAGQVSVRYEQLAERYEREAAAGGVSGFGAQVGGSIFAGVAAEWERNPSIAAEQGMTPDAGGEYGE